MATRELGIIMNGVTGRMGTNQHLMRSLVEIIRAGGIALPGGERLLPRPILVGRNANKLRELAELSGVTRSTTSLSEALADPTASVYFDSQVTSQRFDAVAQAIEAGKHIYCEKPVAPTTEAALELSRRCLAAGVKEGVVQDKLWLPGMIKLRRLRESGFFGRLLSVRAEFGYWVFEGHSVPAQRPSWNYKKEEGGGIIIDMLCHFRYMLDQLFGPVRSVSCLGATHVDDRVDEAGKSYRGTADDAAYCCFELDGGVIAQINASWATRVRRDDLLTVQVDGTHGSAVAGLRKCWTQHVGNTPRPTWNPDIEQPIRFQDGWLEVPEQEPYDNAFKAQWELFLRHVALDTPFPWTLAEGAKGVQLAELALESWRKRAWVPVPDLK